VQLNRRTDERTKGASTALSVQKHSTGKIETLNVMPRRFDANRILSLEKLVTGLPTAEYVMNVTVMYDDAQTRAWAGEIYQKVQAVAGGNSVQGTWWKLADLCQPGVLAGAVSKAIRSDMIVVGVRESEGLPLPFYFWVNAWLPYRVQRSGALVALLGAPNPRHAQTGRLKKFLRVVARRARMDLLLAERVNERPVEAPPFRIPLGSSTRIVI
jgi:hypothetical protein